MRKFIACALLAAAPLTTLACGSEERRAARASQPKNVKVWFEGAKLDELIRASDYAAWCGGGVVVDVDDLEVLVADCDQ
jgi:hypothetical protein